MRFQTTYRGHIDFDATFENLGKLGCEPKRHHPGRGGGQSETGSLTFKLNSAQVTISPKGKYHAIQVYWNSIEEMKKHEKELNTLLVFPHFHDKYIASFDFQSKLMTINVTIPYNSRLLRKIDSAHSEYMKEMARTRAMGSIFG